MPMNLYDRFDKEEAAKELLSPTTGYNERPVWWFRQHILSDFTDKIVGCQSLIDIGCGYGYFTREYANIVPVVLGVDWSQTRIEEAKIIHSVPGITYLRQDITQDILPQKFEAGISSAVFQHIPPDKREAAFRYAHDALEQGATLYMYDELGYHNPKNAVWDGFFAPLTLNEIPSFFILHSVEYIADGLHDERIYRIMLRKRL
jgi:SAM-dependent methyltransferase